MARVHAQRIDDDNDSSEGSASDEFDDIEEGSDNDDDDQEIGSDDFGSDATPPREHWLDRLHGSLSGRTVGRRLKRELFRVAFVSGVGSLLLILLGIAGGALYPNSRWYAQPIAGAPQLVLQHLVAWPQACVAAIGLLLIQHWASLVTNTELLTQLCTRVMYACMALYPFWAWLCISTFVVFQPVTMFGPYGPGVETLYALTVLAVLPYAAVGLTAPSNISYFVAQVREGATVLEPPEEQARASDISGMTLEEFVRFIATKEGEERVDARGRRYRTASGPIAFVVLAVLELVEWARTRVRHQRVAAAISTQSRRIDAVPQGRPAPPLQHSPSQQPPPQQPQASGSNPQDLSSPSSLSSIDFGRLWEQLPLAGSFECTLMEHVTAVQMEQHLRSCGFEVRASDYGNAWEIEVLNQRQLPTEPWFLGEMSLDSSAHIEAVVKCTDETRVSGFMRDLQLSSILKIADG